MPIRGNLSRLPAIHTLWIGDRLGPLELLCINSWLRHGHEVFVHSYMDLNLPKGAIAIDASSLCPQNAIFRNRNGSLAPFSDVYRALILQTYAALWLDADIFLVRPFAFIDPNVLVREGNEKRARLNNSALRLAHDHPILFEILARWRQPWKAIPWHRPKKVWPILTMSIASFGFHARHLPWGALGADAIEKSIEKSGFDGTIVEYNQSLTSHRVNLFEPVDDPDQHLADVIYVHLYRSQAKVNLSAPKPGSIYALLWQR